MSVNRTNLLSGRAQLVPYANLTADRYQFLSLNQAEPSLSSGLVGNVLTIGIGNTRVWTNVLTIASMSATGNISGNYFIGNGSQLTGVAATSIGVLPSLSVTGNTQTGNLLTGGLVSATGNVYTPGVFNNFTGMTLDGGYPGYITFYTGSTPRVTIDDNGNINAGVISAAGNVTGNYILGNGAFLTGVITSVANINNGTSNVSIDTANGNITMAVNGTPNVVVVGQSSVNLANIYIANTTITTDGTIANVVIQPTGSGLAVINTTTGLVLPVGNTTQRPSSGTTGTVRFNTTTSLLEVYNGNAWVSTSTSVTNQTFNGDGSTVAFTLNRSTTTAAALIMLNGITQVPNQSYAMTPSPSTNLVFTEAPAPSDLIDIRFL